MRRVPLAAWICALVGFANAAVFAIVTPAFQVPDEIGHFGYAQYLAETGQLPKGDRLVQYSQEQLRTMELVAFESVAGRPDTKGVWTEEQQRSLDNALTQALRRDDGGGSTTSINNPPLYYGLQVAVYKLSPWDGLLDRLLLMRLLSCLFVGFTVLFTFLFLRELLPGSPWTWSAGALCVAFQPVFAFIASGVTVDSLLYALSAALLYALASAFRHGLTARRGAVLGGLLGAALVTKGTAVAFAPAVAAALAWLVWRARPERAAALRGALLAASAAAAPVALYALLSATVWDRPLWSGTEQFTASVGETPAPDGSSISELAGYGWQLYLPRLPFMADRFEIFPLWDLWFQGFVGRFGWLDYSFPLWAYDLALAILVPVVALAGLALWRSRAALRRRAAELGAYALFALGLLGAIAVAGYGAAEGGNPGFEQARYLLPLMPLYGAVIALAARALPRERGGATVAAVLVVAAVGHGLFGLLATLARYYA